MGGAASVETAGIETMDYNAVKASGVEFSVAYNALQNKLVKGKSSHNINDVSIPFLAIRQLSQNLKNQEHLEKTRKKVLKSRSLPNNLKYKEKLSEDDEEEVLGNNPDEFDANDLDIIADHEYNSMPHGRSNLDSFGNQPNVEHQQPIIKVTKKPVLFLSVPSDESTGGAVRQHAAEYSESAVLKNVEKPLSPSVNARLSPHGTLHVGKMKIKENGIFLSESIRGNDAFQFHMTEDKRAPPVALGGKNDFIVVATLGSGASGVVSEALHVPTLTIVALKMLPVYNQQKRQHVSRELAVLYKNLTDLRLVDDRLNRDRQEGDLDMLRRDSSGSHCTNVLSLYNAFIDPKSGMINLVVEYMDGGSLEDLVKQGGCRDERVLADIAYQTCKGLCFLHQHKSVHRDIKPANILCSSNGVIKIADFGISKALDKTSGFANSFVGTVCYMSPERIVGESYSFPCDIWSLGLTLLAVARGRFPLSGKEDDSTGSPSAKVPRAGANDSLSSPDSPDRNAPIGGAGGYWAMIKAICDEEPPSPGPEFSRQFNVFIEGCLSKDPEDRQSAKRLLHLPFITENVDYLDNPADSDHSRGGGDGETSVRKSALAAKISDSNKSSLQSPAIPPASPMTARNATAAVVRRVSRDFSSPMTTDAHGRLDRSSDPADEQTFPYSVSDSIMEEQGELLLANFDPNTVDQESEDTIINAIRLEHLDRVLDKIAKKLSSQLNAGQCSSPGSNAGDPFMTADDEDGAEEDYADLHQYSQALSSGMDGTASSLDSIDQLLFKEGEPETPQAKKEFMAQRGRGDPDDHFPDLSVAAAGHKDYLAASHNHSILKTGSSYKRDGPEELPGDGAVQQPRHFHLRDTHRDSHYENERRLGDSLQLAESKKGISFVHPTAADAKHAESAGRSVHFSEVSGKSKAAEGGGAPKTKNLRSRLNLKALELNVGDDNDGEDAVGHALPKPSSYFIATSQSKDELDPPTPVTHVAPVVVDYCAMLPKLNATGTVKWNNLASQLHLPLHLVKIAVRAKLGHLVELRDDDKLLERSGGLRR